MPPDEEMSEQLQELVIGVVGAVGTDLGSVAQAIATALSQVGYYCPKPIRLSQLLHQVDGCQSLPTRPFDLRLRTHMAAGSTLRQIVGRGDALALLAMTEIGAEREAIEKTSNGSISRRAYILNSLKHPEEVQTLRRVYGPSFLLVAAYSSQSERVQYLARQIAYSHGVTQIDEFVPGAHRLILRDQSEEETDLGQDVRDAFPMADVFVNASIRYDLQGEIDRFVEALFGHPGHTPRRDEYAMFHAQAAALRSGSLARQVGAVIATDEGDIIAVGANEVPKAGGGLYWAGDQPDYRDYKLGYDTSDQFRRNLLTDTLKRLHKLDLLQLKGEEDVQSLVDKLLAGRPSPLRGAQIMNLIEFVRAVHAEMAAVVDAARRGTAIRGCTLYTTTFPCHDCAKHIVAAGIPRVVYIHPYPKSLASELHLDSIAMDQRNSGPGKVNFESFVGIAPRRYMDFFAWEKRKDKDGKALGWDRMNAIPRLGENAPSFLARVYSEKEEIKHYEQLTQEKSPELARQLPKAIEREREESDASARQSPAPTSPTDQRGD